MATIKGVFFDAAGTLFETRAPVGDTYARLASAYGVHTSSTEVNSAFRRVFRNARPLSFGLGLGAKELRRLERDWWRALVAETFEGMGEFSDFDAYFNSLFEFFADPANWIAEPAALPALFALRERGLTCGVISNFDHRLYRILDGLGLSRCFDSITISSEAGYAKPSVRLFQTALDRHRLTPAEAIHIGDSEHLDFEGASAAGLFAVLLDPNLSEPVLVNGRNAKIRSLKESIMLVNIFDHPSG